MSYLIKYCLPIFVVVLFISCSNTVYKDLWQPQPILVNGNPNELPRSFKFYDNETGLYYTISNDLDNFYISIKTANQQTQMRILRSGIQFCIDTTGKYGDRTKIVFPFAVMQNKNSTSANDDYTPRQGRGQGQDMGQKTENLNSLKKKFMNENKQMHLIGFKSPIGGIVPLPNDYGIKMNITWDSTNAMIYEASIPFVTFYKNSLSDADSSKIIGVSLSLTALPASLSPGGMRPIGGMGTGMSIGMGGIGFGVRIPIGGSGNGMRNSPYQQNTNLKMKMKLALRPKVN